MPGGPSVWNPNSVIGSGVEHKAGAYVLFGNPLSTNRGGNGTSQQAVSTGTAATDTVIGIHGTNFNTIRADSTLPAGSPAHTSGIVKMNSAGTYGKVNAQQYIIYQLKSGQTVAGLSSTVLQNPGGPTSIRRSINFKTTAQTGKFVTAGWNYCTGKFLTAPSVATDSFGTDNAASVTRAIPGVCVFLDSGKTIVSSNYKPDTD